jgi:hypothetical protein
MIYEHAEPWWNDDVNRGNLLIRPAESSGNPTLCSTYWNRDCMVPKVCLDVRAKTNIVLCCTVICLLVSVCAFKPILLTLIWSLGEELPKNIIFKKCKVKQSLLLQMTVLNFCYPPNNRYTQGQWATLHFMPQHQNRPTDYQAVL